jgi:hypothetical protein
MCVPKKQGGMGFRDLHTFNMAMLAKQSWRLLASPDTLCARVLKARYYPSGQLQDIVFTGYASLTWQAIQYGLELLKKGLIWRIGNGSQVRVWRDPWIPRPHSFRPISRQGDCRIRWVADFLNEHGAWKLDLLQCHFLPVDVIEIIKIRPSPRRLDDVLAWAPMRNGIFTVKSVY